ncbi:hypothetical protein T08_10917 [Trichinella sp. T8]|nr:hypothetical protein T08_10917 [Trichinella sp. T8]
MGLLFCLLACLLAIWVHFCTSETLRIHFINCPVGQSILFDYIPPFHLETVPKIAFFSFFFEIFIFFFQYNNHRAYSSTIFGSATIRFATKLVGLVSAQLLLFSKINESIKRKKKNLFIQLAMLTSATPCQLKQQFKV